MPNGLALYAPQGSGGSSGYWVETAMRPHDTPRALSPVRGGQPHRVFPGLTRRLTAAGFDETYGPAAEVSQWRANPAVHGKVNDEGVFRAGAPGRTTVTAWRGKARGTLDLTVLGPLDRIDSTVDRVGSTAPTAVRCSAWSATTPRATPPRSSPPT